MKAKAALVRILKSLLVCVLGFLSVGAARAAANRVTYFYRAGPGAQFALDVFAPSGANAQRRPALVFFHGGSWTEGDKSQFDCQAQILTQKTRLRVISVNYPLHGDPIESTEAARASVCWIRTHANALGVDPGRIALSGGSAGGQLALAATLIQAKLAPECAEVDPPYAGLLILFNPVLDLSGWWEKKAGKSLKDVSPLQLERRHAPPPTLILQGTADRTARIEVARHFVEVARSMGAKNVELIAFPGRQHGFFNVQSNGDLDATVNDAIEFMKKVGWPID